MVAWISFGGTLPREYTSGPGDGGHHHRPNGTRRLRACISAGSGGGGIVPESGRHREMVDRANQTIGFICAGTAESSALEDVLCAGALWFCFWQRRTIAFWMILPRWRARSIKRRRRIWLMAVKSARNGRRLLANPELRDDVADCLRRDVIGLVALLGCDGVVRSQPLAEKNAARMFSRRGKTEHDPCRLRYDHPKIF